MQMFWFSYGMALDVRVKLAARGLPGTQALRKSTPHLGHNLVYSRLLQAPYSLTVY